MARAQLADLRRSAGDRVLMAFAAALRVVDRPEAVSDGLLLNKRGQLRVEFRLCEEPVGLVVERRARLRRSALTLHGQ